VANEGWREVLVASHRMYHGQPPATCPEPTSLGQASAVLDTIVVAPSDSNTLYVGSDQGEVEVNLEWRHGLEQHRDAYSAFQGSH